MTQYLPYTKKEYMAILRKDLREYEAKIGDVTAEERKDLRKWVADGHSPYENPCLFCDDDGYVMDFITAVRIWEDMSNDPEAYSRVSDTEPGGTYSHDDEMPF